MPTDREFIGDLTFLERIRQLEAKIARLERWSEASLEAYQDTGATVTGEQQARQGTPPLRHINVRYVSGFPANAEARPGHVLPLDARGNFDLRKSGGEIRANTIIADGGGDNVAAISGVDDTWRIWSGASAAGSASFRVDKSGNMVATAGSIAGFEITEDTLQSGSFGINRAQSRFTFDLADTYVWQTANNIVHVVSGQSVTHHSPSAFINVLAWATTVATLAEWTADQDDADLGNVHVVRVSSDATRTLTGIDLGIPQGFLDSGKHYWLVNVGGNDILIANQDANSAASNRIITGTGTVVTISPSKVAHLFYDATSTKWRLLSNT